MFERGSDKSAKEKYLRKDRNSEINSSQVVRERSSPQTSECFRSKDQQSRRSRSKFEVTVQENRNEEVGPGQKHRTPHDAASQLARPIQAEN